MKKSVFSALIAVLVLVSLVSPKLASAHGHTVFEIKGKVYSFTLGSLNEPVAVDDKTGVDLRIETMPGHHSGNHDGAPVTGLEKTLQVELKAGDKTKVLSLSAAYNDPGAYRAYFTPTVQTTYSYRIFGTIDGVAFNYTWSCNPAGHPQTEADKSAVEVSEGVKRVEATGAFGCPAAKADMGFPEASTTTYDLRELAQDAKSSANSARVFGIIGMVFGIIALGASRRSRKE